MAATLASIGKAAGVSVRTASVVLNGDPKAARISQPTIERVRKVAEEMGYHPNHRARALATRRSNCLGLIYAANAPIVHSFYPPLLAAVAQEVAARGIDLMLIPALPGTVGWEDRLSERRVDGVLAFQPAPDDMVEVLQRHNVPGVMINEAVEQPVPRVLLDDDQGFGQLVEHLFELGHERLGYLGMLDGTTPLDPHETELQRPMFVKRHAAQLRMPEPLVLPTRSHADAADAALDAGVTAVLCYADPVALHFIQRLKAMRIDVPRQMSVTGCNNEPASYMAHPRLTTLRPRVAAMAEAAVNVLLAQVEGKTGSDLVPEVKVLPWEIMTRESTFAPPRS